MKTILIVDDSAVALEVARAGLEDAGFSVTTRSQGEGTVVAILQQKPDLVLLDVQMPRTRGDTIASIVAGAAPDQKTILLLYSGLPPEILALKVKTTGAHGFIRKTDVADLVDQVCHWLKVSRPQLRLRFPKARS